jgi:hypothetical protein
VSVDCPHWSDCGVKGGGCCALGRFGGRPSRGTCLICLGLPQDAPPALPATTPPPCHDATFRELWEEIHDPARKWEKAFQFSIWLRLPCGDCKKHFTEYVQEHPIPFGDDAACWTWGVRFHDAVNARLGKPIMGLEAARERHRPQE